MRNMSFALTEQQVRDRIKTVTRRVGWEKLKAGDLIQPVRKCMGLKAGEKVEKIRNPIRIVGVHREPLSLMTEIIEYGLEECRKEGFGDHPYFRYPSEFVKFFCSTHRGVRPESIITRITFEYTNS